MEQPKKESLEEKIVSPSDYRKKVYRAYNIKLPSGHVFKIRRLSPIDFISAGLKDLPNPFLDFVSTGTQESFVKVTKDKDSLEVFKKFMELTVEKGVVEPKIMLDFDESKKETHLYWNEIDEKDQLTIVNAILRGDLKN